MTGLGGFKELIALIEGKHVYSRLKYESGVHRVQRVPATESQGRIHTSAVTVAVLPEAEEIEVEIDANDLKIDVFRSSGPGGQHVNKTDAGGSIGWSFFTLLTPFAATPLLMYLVRGLLGLAEGLNFPGSTTVLSRWVPRKARARIQGLNLSGVAAGPLIATPLTVWIMTLFGWKAVFYFYGVLGFLWAVAWLLYSTENPSEHRRMTSEELREIEASQAAEEGVSVGDAPVRSKAVWGLAAAYFCFTYTWWLFLNWLPTYLVQARGFTVIKMGFYASLPWLAALISSNAAGWLSDALVTSNAATGSDGYMIRLLQSIDGGTNWTLVDGYQFNYETGAGAYQIVAELGYINTSPTPGKKYTYKVTASKIAGTDGDITPNYDGVSWIMVELIPTGVA